MSGDGSGRVECVKGGEFGRVGGTSGRERWVGMVANDAEAVMLQPSLLLYGPNHDEPQCVDAPDYHGRKFPYSLSVMMTISPRYGISWQASLGAQMIVLAPLMKLQRQNVV